LYKLKEKIALKAAQERGMIAVLEHIKRLQVRIFFLFLFLSLSLSF
jgi:hypothetical protein